MLTILWPLLNLIFLSLNPCTVALQSNLGSGQDQRLTPRQWCFVLGRTAQSPQPPLLTSLPHWPVINPWTISQKKRSSLTTLQALTPTQSPAMDFFAIDHLNSSTDPLCNFEEQEKVPSTADIRHFFDRTLKETVCKYCKKACDTNPVMWAQTYSKHDCMFQYSPNTGTSALCGHIDCHHIQESLALAEANKWQIWLESVKAIMA
ncbi:hypothetical protein BDN67DRAFT_984292 [Paxillus ammoniavirescens]|nr:hypothetical protein BDN67DRAFT_984292 [Paxillus ammoniavirescens]